LPLWIKLLKKGLYIKTMFPGGNLDFTKLLTVLRFSRGDLKKHVKN
jgi:hypothetical protein